MPFIAFRAPSVWKLLIGVLRPVEANGLARHEAMCHVLTDEGLWLRSMLSAVDRLAWTSRCVSARGLLVARTIHSRLQPRSYRRYAAQLHGSRSRRLSGEAKRIPATTPGYFGFAQLLHRLRAGAREIRSHSAWA